MPEPTDLSQALTDPMDPARARALQVALGQEPTVVAGGRLPLLFHHLHFWDPQPPGALAPDGAPRRDGPIPDLGLPHRVLAAGRLVLHHPLVAGTQATRLSRVDATMRKDGPGGPMAVLRLRHDIRQRHRLALTEWQEIVLRAAPPAAGPPDAPAGGRPDAASAGPPGPPAGGPRDATPLGAPPARRDEDSATPLRFDAVLLFRFAALTCDARRVHLDREAAARAGHPGLPVQVPLMLLALLQARPEAAEPVEIAWRATGPLHDGAEAAACWKGATGWLRGPGGAQCLLAEVR